MKHIIPLLAALAAASSGAAALAGDTLNSREQQRLAPFLGFYQGAFDTAVTATPLDDMNVNPCRDCDTHGDPLKDIYLKLGIDGDRLRISFHRTPDAPPFDLLGKYCHSDIGALESLESAEGKGKDSGDAYRVTTATFAFDAGRCPRNITENKAPELTLSLMENRTQGMHFAKVEIDKDLRRVVTLTAKNREGERVPVKSNPNDYGKDRRETRTYVYEDEMGADDDYLRSNTTETRYFAIPVVLNGYVGANLTWWPHKILDVEAETEEVLSRHTGVFMPVPAELPPPD
ncbi:hypothetical protein [Parahaliea mediterranea]|uniref:DUF3108 domain-containing protein n=1 Tax=Parahaliea mediterranea TaxID=651086 RepID=A0A939DFK4_9GAMM|nr:hypothetical protein [Parahaliea mediterranea]MBN7796602.1 hypothetical protein [Parahaliea mediterranea]